VEASATAFRGRPLSVGGSGGAGGGWHGGRPLCLGGLGGTGGGWQGEPASAWRFYRSLVIFRESWFEALD